MTTLNLQVGASTDDAHEWANGTVLLGLNPIAAWHIDEEIGFRWTEVLGLSGATINTSSLQIYNEASSKTYINDKLEAEDAASPGTFTDTDHDLSGRTPTTADVSWVEDSGLGGWRTSPSINSIIQELADSYDPTTIVIRFDRQATGDWYIATYDGDTTLAAKLDIDYSAASGAGEDVVGEVGAFGLDLQVASARVVGY